MKKLITIFLTLFMLLSAAACQPTPEKAVVVKKDTERMIEQAAQPSNGAAIDEVGIPEGRYTFSAEGLNGRLRINVDAEIEAPAAQAMPIVRVEQGGAGLGLAIVQRIASAHGATLTAESIPGEFTAIKIVFPTK